MKMRKIFALGLALLILALPGCGKEKPQAAPKAGVVYLDPNAAPAQQEAPKGMEQKQTDPIAAAEPQETAAAAEPEEAAAEPSVPEGPLDLYFECRGVRIEPLMEAAPVLAALGEPLHRFEADSCAYVGTKDVFYSYPGMELTVNEMEGVERISAIKVTDDTVTIPQGLRIYDEEEKLLSILGGVGEDGVYTYRNGRVQLVIQVTEAGDDRRIAYIEYCAAEDQ